MAQNNATFSSDDNHDGTGVLAIARVGRFFSYDS